MVPKVSLQDFLFILGFGRPTAKNYESVFLTGVRPKPGFGPFVHNRAIISLSRYFWPIVRLIGGHCVCTTCYCAVLPLWTPCAHIGPTFSLLFEQPSHMGQVVTEVILSKSITEVQKIERLQPHDRTKKGEGFPWYFHFLTHNGIIFVLDGPGPFSVASTVLGR